MSESKHNIIWTIQVDKNLDAAVRESINPLGYTSKAELSCEAVREFLIYHKLFSLIGGESVEPIIKQELSPELALQE
jgi:hypothetical protein